MTEYSLNDFESIVPRKVSSARKRGFICINKGNISIDGEITNKNIFVNILFNKKDNCLGFRFLNTKEKGKSIKMNVKNTRSYLSIPEDLKSILLDFRKGSYYYIKQEDLFIVKLEKLNSEEDKLK